MRDYFLRKGKRLSTVTAHRSLDEMNMGGGARRRVVDKVAAAVILQAWLDRRAEQLSTSVDRDGPVDTDAASKEATE